MKRAIVACLACGAAACAAVAVATYIANLDSIPAVRTWGELERRPTIDIGGGATIRLGMESKSCPAGSGVLVYCLAEGLPSSLRTSSNQLGPVRVRVSGDDTLTSLHKGVEDYGLEQGADGQTPRFFLKVIEVPHVGRLTIEVLSHKGEVLATSRIRGTDEPLHPWIPWNRAMETMETGALASGRALPNWDGVRGMVKPSDGHLPRLFPAEVDPDLTIEKVGMSLRVTLRREVDRSWKLYLSRWWVNGRAFQPESVSFDEIWEGMHDRQQVRTLALPFNAESLGARRGETIGLQLLYCPRGWSQQGPEREQPYSLWDDDEAFPHVSNKIEFIAE